ncbi:hypothetical protein UT300005_21570 [Clostridium sp. CTA-5]
MKKSYISFLIMTLTLVNTSLINISSVQAATVQSTNNKIIKVSLENIKDIMIDNSLDMKTYDNNLKKVKEEYDESKDEVKTAQTDKQDAEDKLAADDKLDSNKTKQLQNDLTLAENNLDTKNTNLDTKTFNYTQAKLQYDQKVESAVYQAQQDYIKYLSTLANKELQEDTAKSKEKNAQISKLKYESGFMSKNDYISSTQDNTDSSDKLNELINEEKLEKTKLCNELGISEENATIITDINEDIEKISKINYDSDLKEMLDNNVDIRLANNNIDQLDSVDNETDNDYTDAINDYNKDNAEISLQQKNNIAKINFKEQYDTLMNSYNSIKSSYNKITQEQNEYKITQSKYDYGFVSKNYVDNEKLTLDKDNATFVNSRNKCYLDYLKYIQMKEGY